MPEISDAALLARRAAAYIATEQWALAKADWSRATRQQPEQLQQAFDDFRKAERWNEAAEFGLRLAEANPVDSLGWVKVAPVIARAEDDNSYVEFCKWVAKQPAETPEQTDRAIKVCLLKAGVVDITDLPGDTLARGLNDGTVPAWLPPSGWGCLALLAYRNGDAESAVKYVAQSEQHSPNDFAHAMNLAVLAMAENSLDHPDKARTALQESSQLISRLKTNSDNKGHHDLLIAEILFREAKAKINGQSKSTGEAADSSADADKTRPQPDSTDVDAPAND